MRGTVMVSPRSSPLPYPSAREVAGGAREGRGLMLFLDGAEGGVVEVVHFAHHGLIEFLIGQVFRGLTAIGIVGIEVVVLNRDEGAVGSDGAVDVLIVDELIPDASDGIGDVGIEAVIGGVVLPDEVSDAALAVAVIVDPALEVAQGDGLEVGKGLNGHVQIVHAAAVPEVVVAGVVDRAVAGDRLDPRFRAADEGVGLFLHDLGRDLPHVRAELLEVEVLFLLSVGNLLGFLILKEGGRADASVIRLDAHKREDQVAGFVGCHVNSFSYGGLKERGIL